MFYLRRVAVENDPYRDSPSTLTEEGGEGSGEAGSSGGKGGRKSLFKKKGTSTSISSVLKKTSSVSSIIEDQPEVSTKSFCCLFEFLPDILYQLHSQTLACLSSYMLFLLIRVLRLVDGSDTIEVDLEGDTSAQLAKWSDLVSIHCNGSGNLLLRRAHGY